MTSAQDFLGIDGNGAMIEVVGIPAFFLSVQAADPTKLFCLFD